MTIQLERSSRPDDMTTLVRRRVPGTAWKPRSTPAGRLQSGHGRHLHRALAVRGRRGRAARTWRLRHRGGRPVLGDYRPRRRRGSARLPQRVPPPRIRILDDDRGQRRQPGVPYHHWTYGVDGCLRHADNQPATFDRSRFGLKPVQVRSVGGLVFICVADEPPDDFDEVAARIEPYLAPYELGRTKVAHQVAIVEERQLEAHHGEQP